MTWATSPGDIPGDPNRGIVPLRAHRPSPMMVPARPGCNGSRPGGSPQADHMTDAARPPSHDGWGPEEWRRALYRAGYRRAARGLRDGFRPEEVRIQLDRLAERLARPWSAETVRGIEDALAGRPEEA